MFADNFIQLLQQLSLGAHERVSQDDRHVIVPLLRVRRFARDVRRLPFDGVFLHLPRKHRDENVVQLGVVEKRLREKGDVRVPVTFRKDERVFRQTHGSRFETDPESTDVSNLVFLVAETKGEHADERASIHPTPVVLNDDAVTILWIFQVRKIDGVDVYRGRAALSVLRADRVENQR